LDHIGPLRADVNGSMFILVITDAFSRWVELYPSKITTAVETASCIFQHFGTRGTAFHFELVQELLCMSGIVKRANQEVLRHLNAILFDSRVHDRWSFEQLPMVQRIMNTVEKTPTGVTPAQLSLSIPSVYQSKYSCHSRCCT